MLKIQEKLVNMSASLLLLCALQLMLMSCSENSTVKIGIIGGLTGRVADLGIAGRDGAMLAVEEINASGGIDGRRIELIIKDDKQDNKACEQAVAELVKHKVVGIIGPMTSSMGMIVAQQINENDIPTISPTVSTSELTDIDDYFFRIIPDITNAATKTASYAFNDKGYRKILFIYDLGNRAFTEPWFLGFKSHFEKLGGQQVVGVDYVSSNSFNFLELLQQKEPRDFDCLVIIASALDTAMISQQLRKQNLSIPILASEWAATDNIIEYGGQAVEGIEILHSFDRNNQTVNYLAFVDRFQDRFGYPVSFAAAYSYNAAKILLKALARETQPEKIKNAIVKGSPYDGVQRKIQFNQYGDVEREYTLLKIHGNRIISL